MAQNDLVKALGEIASQLSGISGQLAQLLQIAETQADSGGQIVGQAPQSPVAVAQSNGGGDGIAKASPASKQSSKTTSAALGIGLDTLVGFTDPTQSKFIGAAEGARSLAKFGAAALGDKVAGDAGSQIAAAGVDAALNLSGINQQISSLNQAKSSLFSRVAAASDAGIVYSDSELQEIASSEIGRSQEKAAQVNRAVKAFDSQLAQKGLSSLEKAVGKEQVDILRKIEANTRKLFGAGKSQRGSGGG